MKKARSKKKYFVMSGLALFFAVFLLPFLFQTSKQNSLNRIEPETRMAAAIAAQTNDSARTEPGQTGSNYSYVTKNHPYGPNVSARAYLVGDLDTGEVILSQGKDAKYPQASVSKLMTAYLALVLNKNDDTAVISKTALSTEGPSAGLRQGEKIKVSALFYPLLLESSNDVAEAIAEHFGRSVFMDKMNRLSEYLGLDSTFYKDPSGLSRENKTSVSDMFRLAGFIYKNAESILKITTVKNYTAYSHSWRNNSQFLNDQGYLGGKNGYTDPALETATALYSVKLAGGDTRNIAITVLQSNDRHKDVETILKYVKDNIRYDGPSGQTSNWVFLKPGSPDISWPDHLSLVLGGDIMLDRGVKNSVNKNFGGDYSKLFNNLGIFKEADAAFAEILGPISYQGEDQGYLNPFRMSPAVLPALESSGLSALSVANDHMYDWGRDAFLDTLQNLKRHGIGYAGAGIDKQTAGQPVIIDKYGIKIGFLPFSDYAPASMAAADGKPGVLSTEYYDFSKIVQDAAKQADFLVVYFQFGKEYQKKHDSRQTDLAHLAIDSGARLVVGSGPHVIEDTEKYKNGYIAYSLGNLIFDQSFSKDTMQGMLLEATVNRDGSFSVRPDTVTLNSQFQPQKPVQGKEENIKAE